MINVEVIDIDPFKRTELSPSYASSIGSTYPAIAIYDTDKEISVYDGIVNIDKEHFDMKDMTVGGLFKLLKSKGINSKVFKGMEKLPALSISTYSNVSYLHLFYCI